MCDGGGACARFRCTFGVVFFLLLVGCVSWLGPLDVGQVIQRLQDLETVAVEQLDRELSKVHNGIALCWTKRMTWIGQVVNTRVLGKLDKLSGSR